MLRPGRKGEMEVKDVRVLEGVVVKEEFVVGGVQDGRGRKKGCVRGRREQVRVTYFS